MLDSGRRRLLRGGRDIGEPRPPWLKAPMSFTEDCTRCGQCMELCPQQIVRIGDGGFPMVNFDLGECVLCGECTTHCEAGLFLDAPERGAAWDHAALISERCLTHLGVLCRSCEDACEPRAIRFPLAAGSVPKPEVDAQLCTGCGGCIRPCPEQAIAMA